MAGIFQQIFKDMKEEDQHTKLPSPQRTLSLTPLPLHQHTHTHLYKPYNKHPDDTLITNMKNYPFIVFSVGSVFNWEPFLTNFIQTCYKYYIGKERSWILQMGKF